MKNIIATNLFIGIASFILTCFVFAKLNTSLKCLINQEAYEQENKAKENFELQKALLAESQYLIDFALNGGNKKDLLAKQKLLEKEISKVENNASMVFFINNLVAAKGKLEFKSLNNRLANNLNYLKEEQARLDAHINTKLKIEVVTTISLSLFFLLFFVSFIQNLAKITLSFKLMKALNNLEDPHVANLKFELALSSKKHRDFAIIGSVFIVVLVLITSYFINFEFIPAQSKLISDLEREGKSANSLVMYLLGRAFMFGSFFGLALFYLFKLSNGSFDQSVRSMKRLDSTLFFQYLYNELGHLIQEGKLTLKDFMDAFEQWTQPVHTAFSGHTAEPTKLSTWIAKVRGKSLDDTVQGEVEASNKE